jgi:HD-GYP domain-containing protein (c-di-GMP phosphodiesterase class II)
LSTTIAIDDVRVGMYVQLDGGWMRHPFARSSFRIGEAAQLLALRQLGLSHVRWVPEKSDLSHEARLAPVAPDVHQEQPRGGLSARRGGAWRVPLPTPLLTPTPTPTSPEATTACEQHFAEAALAWRQASDLVLTQPRQAGAQVTALTRRVLAHMPEHSEIGIRLLPTRAPRAAAHAINVAVISLLMGRTLGMGDDELLDLGVGALAHDVGKLVLAERHRHLEANGKADEAAAYYAHTAEGLRLGQTMGFGSTALSVLAQHHERADGSGFPEGLVAERQSLAARIVAIVNQYDRLCNPATRSVPLTPHEAVATLFALGHKRFDVTVLNAFIRLMGVYPAGSLVQLTDDRYALVVSVNSSRPLKPIVLVHHDGDHRLQASPRPQRVDLQRTPNVGIRRSLTANRLPVQALQALNPCAQVLYFFETLTRRATDPRDTQELAA